MRSALQRCPNPPDLYHGANRYSHPLSGEIEALQGASLEYRTFRFSLYIHGAAALEAIGFRSHIFGGARPSGLRRPLPGSNAGAGELTYRFIRRM
jgi:hypothetical protein